MRLYDSIISRRTIREFKSTPIKRELLDRFVNAGRLAPQAANKQPLEFVIVNDAKICEQLFSLVKFASYLEWKPSKEKQPASYIVIVVNEQLQLPAWVSFDAAYASANICLAAWEEGIGSCLIGAFNKGKIEELLNIPSGYSIALLVALGYPTHRSVVEEVKNNNIAYWRDEDGTFHVPKRPLKKITHYNKF